MPRSLAAVILLAASSLSIDAEDWPHWRGIARDGTTSESSGWEEGAWPLVEAWMARIGQGSSSVLVAGGRVYGLGHSGGGETVSCLDAGNGSILWEQSYQAPVYGRHSTGDKNFYGGPSATPEFDSETGLLYTLGIDGDLRCWDSDREGELVWGLNLYDAYAIPQRPQVTERAGSLRDYGYATAPMVAGAQLLVGAGDPRRGNILAFDKKSGKLLWGSQNKDAAGHAGGLVPVRVAEKPCVVSLTATQVVVTELSAGREAGAFPWATDFINNIATPAVLANGSIVATSDYNLSATAALAADGEKLRLVWRSGESSGVGSPVVHGDAIYLGSNGLRCLDAGSGKVRWSGGKFSEACSLLLTGDQRLIVWANDGDLALVEGAGRSPGAFQLLAERKGLLHDMAWPHVVLADGRLYCKDRAGNLKCLAVSQQARALLAKVEVAPKSKGTPAKPALASGFDLANWPANEPEAILAWKKGGGKRGFTGALAKAGRWSLTARGEAGVDPDGSLRPNGGGFAVGGDMGGLCEVFRKAGALTIEMIFTSAATEQVGPARLLTFSESPFSRNVTLGQENDALVLRLRTPVTGENGMSPETVLCKIEAGRPYHCLVSYGTGTVACYLNGAEVYREADRVTGDFSNWTAQHLLIGDEWDAPRPWHGRVEGFAFYARPVDAIFAARRYEEVARP